MKNVLIKISHGASPRHDALRTCSFYANTHKDNIHGGGGGRADVCIANAAASSLGTWCGLSGETQGLPTQRHLEVRLQVEEVKRGKAPANL